MVTRGISRPAQPSPTRRRSRIRCVHAPHCEGPASLLTTFAWRYVISFVARHALSLTLAACLVASAGSRLAAQEHELPLGHLTPADIQAFADQIIDEARAALDRILSVKGRRTVANTLRPYDDLQIQTNAFGIVRFLPAVHPDPAVRAAALEAIRRRDSMFAAIRLGSRLCTVLRQVDQTRADAETRFYLARLLRDCRRDGFDRDGPTRTRIADLRVEIARLERAFQENIRRDTTPLIVEDAAELEGMPADWIEAQPRQPDGDIRVAGDLRFVVQNATKSATREKAFTRLQNRGAPANHFVVDSLRHKRHELALLLGYRSWAAYQLETLMARSPARAARFLDDVAAASAPSLARDLEHIQAVRQQSQQTQPLQQWDLLYLLRQSLPEESVARAALAREYFTYDGVRNALLQLADTLFGLEFRAASDVPVWHPDVEAFRVFDGERLIGIAYLDARRRRGKPPASSTAPIRIGVRDRVLARAAINLSLPNSQPGDTALLAPDEVKAFFHEFGHLINMLVAVRPWFGTSGEPAERDGVEVPSILFEHLAHDPAVLRRFARHFRTGQPIPDSIIPALQLAGDLGGGLVTRAIIGRSRVSLVLHDAPVTTNLDSLVTANLLNGLPVDPPRFETHQEAGFTHLVGYEAAYYTYPWSAVIAEDLLSRFKSGLLDPVLMREYKRTILEPARSAPFEQLIITFLGRPFTPDAWTRAIAGR